MTPVELAKKNLEQIAERENGELLIEHFDISLGDGLSCPKTDHKLKFTYKDSTIYLNIVTSTSDIAIATCNLSRYIRPIGFEITSISPFANLFFRRKSRFKVHCKHKNFNYFLKNKALRVFDHTMKTKNFDPSIFTLEKEDHKKIIIEFHLTFPEWPDIFEEIIAFFKSITDELQSDKRNVSHEQYKQLLKNQTRN